MDVMKPQLEWIDGMCYRINPVDFGKYTNAKVTAYYEEDDVNYCPLEATEEDVEEITVDDSGRCRASFHVPQTFFAYLIGSKGASKKNLEYETRTNVNIPKPGREGDIVVTGASKTSVASARARILMMVKAARNRKRPTHFISIPLTNPAFQQSFLHFKSLVLENCQDRGVEDTIFISEKKLHLTVTVFVVSDDTERKETALALKRCKELVVDNLLEHRPLKLKMEGIDYMNDDPSAVNVLYANVSTEDPQLLQNLLDHIKKFFSEVATYKLEQRENVKIHATLMNTRYKSDEHTKTRETFDARTILELYSKYQFGEAVVDRIDLSIRHTICPNTGYYIATESISLT